MQNVKQIVKLTSVDNAIRSLLEVGQPVGRVTAIDLENAVGRVLAGNIVAPRDVPHYDLSFMDGFALRSADADAPGKTLKLAGEGRSGEGFCLQVRTGGAVPEWADAVLRLEDAEALDGGILTQAAVRAGDAVMPRGTTAKKGDVIFCEGTRLTPTDAGTLARLGLTQVNVYDRPRVLIIPTGDELVKRGVEPGPGFVNDGNGMLCYQIAKHCGGDPSIHGIVCDELPALEAALREGLAYDLVVTTGGTSIGPRDRIAEAVDAVGAVLFHGVKIRPGRPMGTGYVEGNGRRVPVLFLPGTMEACSVTALTFIGPVVRYLGRYPEPSRRTEAVVLTKGIFKFPGARALAKVHIEGDRATPVSIAGDRYPKGEYAYVIVPESVEKYKPGDSVKPVYLE
jgi:molybdopterin molybdotransferase